MTAWIAASILGPRKGRFYYDEEGKRHANDFPGHSVALKVLGVMILWFGWCVSIASVRSRAISVGNQLTTALFS